MVLEKEYSPITSTPGLAPAPPRKRNGGTKARQSLRKTLAQEAGNDDDAERSILESREVVGEVSTPPRSTSTESNQSLSLTPQKEHYEGCLKLFAENKITRENAWNLRLIDYMTTMLRRRDARMDDLQTASVLVEASARIYGCRVDSLHHDVLVMAGGLTKAVHSKRGKKNDENAEDDGAAPEGSGASQQKKKKKRLKGATAANPDALTGDFETNLQIDPFFEMVSATSGDVTSSARAFNATLPIHDDTMALILRTDTAFLEAWKENVPPEREVPGRITLQRRLVPACTRQHRVCEPFAGFSMLHWDPDTEESEYRRYLDSATEALNLSQQAVAFDADADVEPIPLDDPHNDLYDLEPPGGVESEEEGDVAVAACVARAAAPPPPRLTDLRPAAVTDARLEYSYCGIQSAWAGPAHWRLKHNRASHTANPASTAASALLRKQARARRQPDFLGAGLAFDWRAPAPEFEPAPPAKIMISRKTLATGTTWNENNYKTPIDRGLDESFFRKLFCRGRVSLERRRKEPDHVSVEPARDYDYDNENDASYCPLNVQEGDEWGPADGTAACDVHGPLKPTQHDDIGETIEPPPKIPKIFIPYALRAKKVDMKQLKRCTWETLTEGSRPGAESVARTSFFSVYWRVQRRLAPAARAALSVPLALLALLHLANERGLRLAQRDDLRDIDILGLIQ